MPAQLLMRRPNLEDLPPVPEPPPGYLLRQLAPGDEERLAETLQRAFPEIVWTPDHVRERLRQAPDVLATYVVDCEGLLVATASVRDVPDRFPGSGYLHWVGTHPGHTGRGLGRLVSLRCLHHFREIGCRDSVLETDDFRLPAIRLYLRLGYAPEEADPSHPERWEKIRKTLNL
jgi:mycothiol synthase